MLFFNKIKNYFWVIISAVFLAPQIIFGQTGSAGNTGAGGGGDTGVGGGGDTGVGGGGNSTKGLENPLKVNSLTDFLAEVLKIIRDIGFVVAVIFIVYAGFLFVTAGGDESKLTKARQAFLWAVVGTAVLLGAQVFATALKESVGNIRLE